MQAPGGGGDACESNTPETFCAPHNGFEGRGGHQTPTISVCQHGHGSRVSSSITEKTQKQSAKCEKRRRRFCQRHREGAAVLREEAAARGLVAKTSPEVRFLATTHAEVWVSKQVAPQREYRPGSTPQREFWPERGVRKRREAGLRSGFCSAVLRGGPASRRLSLALPGGAVSCLGGGRNV